MTLQVELACDQVSTGRTTVTQFCGNAATVAWTPSNYKGGFPKISGTYPFGGLNKELLFGVYVGAYQVSSGIVENMGFRIGDDVEGAIQGTRIMGT